ncbi:MAG: iron-sulfur cluster carrier protein ApbC [Methylococcaceae bacterium]|jgi:ATP-binding protein involved in chromosome partitioning
MPLSPGDVENCLKTWIDPSLGQNLVCTKMIRKIEVDGETVRVEVVLGYPAKTAHDELRQALTGKIKTDTGATTVTIDINTHVVSHAVQKNLKPLAGVKNIVAIASGKGGVGKSTTAVNLALALLAEGARVGILDADIYGPSQPLMLGLQGRPEVKEGSRIIPMQAYGLQAMSIGFLVDEDQPMIWRGPMVTGALQQLLNNTEWDNLDYLIIDLPPGTGDIQLTLSQQIPVSGALIVTTPQDIALLDAQRGFKMFQQVSVPVLGLVENMSIHICSNCGHAEHIFGEGGGQKMAQKYGMELLGALPLELSIRKHADAGFPTVVAEPDSPSARIYREIARKMAARLAIKARDYSAKFPTISVVSD